MSLDLKLDTTAIPINRRNRIFRRFVFRRLRNEAFLVGEDFEVTYSVTNIDMRHFPGGVLNIDIEWPNGQKESSPYQIRPLNVGEHQPIRAPWGVLAPGFSLFFAVMHQGATLRMTSQGLNIFGGSGFSNLYRDEARRHRILRGASFFSVFGQNPEEFYELWGMMMAAVGLFILMLLEVLPSLIEFVEWVLLSVDP